MWIEIFARMGRFSIPHCHHPHGWCGLKSIVGEDDIRHSGSPPTWVVWIEIHTSFLHHEKSKKSPPTRVVWIEINYADFLTNLTRRHHPHGWCGLKF